ncbi:MAG: tetratricopeptide repeat protein [Gemmatimonadales bacterium]
MQYRFYLCALATIALARPAFAQCPDGTPPPCRGATRATGPATNSLAVLTFDNVSRDTNDAYLAEGLANDISARLAQVERLTVTSRTMVRRLPNSASMTPQAMGRALSATYLVSGGIQRGPGRMHVSVELLRSATGQTVWSSQFDRGASDLLAIQQEIASHVATDVTGRLLPGDRARLAARPTISPEAYDHVLHGDFLMRSRSARDMERALTEYETATRLDPRSARALAGYAMTLATCADWGRRCHGLTPDSLRSLASAAVREALAIDSLSAEAYRARSEIEYDRNLADGLRDAERAVVLDPGNPDLHHLRGWILAEMLRYDEAILAYRQALALDPGLAATHEHLARVAIVQRRMSSALAELDTAIALEPGMDVAYARRAILRAWLGDRPGAVADMDAASRSYGGPGAVAARAGVEALLLAAAGDTANARAREDSLVAAGQFSEPLGMAMLRTGRGNEWLASLPPNAALEPFWMQYPQYDAIRSDPRFVAALERYRQGIR